MEMKVDWSLSGDPVKGWTLLDDMCQCSACQWKGPIAECVKYQDSDGWEYTSYTVFTCPVCSLGGDDGEVDFFWSSIMEAFEQAKDDRDVHVYVEEPPKRRSIKVRGVARK